MSAFCRATPGLDRFGNAKDCHPLAGVFACLFVNLRRRLTPLEIKQVPDLACRFATSVGSSSEPSHITFIGEAAVTSASAPYWRQLKRLVNRENTGSEVWADSA